MKLKILMVVSALMASGIAVADTYQSEISASASRVDWNAPFASDSNQYNINGRYYFNAVDTTNVPLAEAAFLGKNSSIYADVSRQQRKATIYDIDGTKLGNFSVPALNTYKAGTEFYIPESFLYIAGSVSQSKSSSRSDGNVFFSGYTKNDWNTSIGVTPIDGLLVSTDYNHDQGYDLNIHGKYVTDIGNGQFVNITAGLADTDGGSTANIGGDFYFDNTLSVGGGVSRIHRQYGGNSNEYTLRTRKFFTEQFSGELFYTDMSDGNAIVAGVSFRF